MRVDKEILENLTPGSLIFLERKDRSNIHPCLLLRNFKKVFLCMDIRGRLKFFKKDNHFVLLNTRLGIIKVDGSYLMGRTKDIYKKGFKPRYRVEW